MKYRIRACRVVLTSGNVVMDYLDGFGMRGFVFAGAYINQDYSDLYKCNQEDFEESIKEWAKKLQDDEDVEYIEFI